MSDLSETASEESGYPLVSETLNANAQCPSPIQEPEDIKSDKSSSVSSEPQIMAQFDGKVQELGVQTDLSFPLNLPDNVQNVLNAYTVMAELSDVESPSSETVLIDSSGSEYLQPNPLFNYDIPSPPLTDEDLQILYESLSSEELDAEVFQRALQEYRGLSPPSSDIESQMIPDNLEVLEISTDKKETEDSNND